ncbi:MAG: polysaccharide deacetylase family protein [Chitinophagaceae bacterium]|nr:polysaccharide deacetylase family protein [Chitinophagaceae bacterium]
MRCGRINSPTDSYLQSVIVYATDITPRLKYILDFISNEITVEQLLITDNKNEFSNAETAKINYSSTRITDNECWIKPHGLLAENNITEQSIGCFEWNDSNAFFKTEGDFPFDIFAASFYLLSRYEEYLPHEKDMYGRYAHENSLAFREIFLNIPLVNQWLQVFKKVLKQQFPSFALKNTFFKFQQTYDIDEAFSYKHKGWFRNAGGAVKDVLKGNWSKVGLRQKVLSNKVKDTYDSYEWMDELHQQYNLKPNYFFLVPEKNGQYDKNILPANTAMQSLIKQHADKYTVGIHPSWQSGDEHSLLGKEIKILEGISGKTVTTSRQHFIRFTLPDTFRRLVEAGIKDDYSMGYGSINGFRASVASSFYWYDLVKEEQTELLLYPFCYMEANSFYEQKVSSQQALEEMLHYLNEVKKVNGTLITLWHNTFLGTNPFFVGWREVYQQFIKEAAR